MIKKILIGIDDSKQAEYAAEYGFGIAHQFNAEVGLVNIVNTAVMTPIAGTDPIMGLPSPDAGIDELDIMDMQMALSENVVKQIISKFAGDLKVEYFTEYGSTADGIVSCSVEFMADLIVIGTHNRTGLDRLFSGSIAEHVVRLSHIPVLVVPFKSIADGQ